MVFDDKNSNLFCDDKKKNWISMTEESNLFFICFKRMKNIFQEESFNHNLNLCNKHKNDHVLSLSLFQKSAYVKEKSDLYLRKIQIGFLIEKNFRSAFNKDANLFLF